MIRIALKEGSRSAGGKNKTHDKFPYETKSNSAKTTLKIDSERFVARGKLVASVCLQANSWPVPLTSDGTKHATSSRNNEYVTFLGNCNFYTFSSSKEFSRRTLLLEKKMHNCQISEASTTWSNLRGLYLNLLQTLQEMFVNSEECFLWIYRYRCNVKILKFDQSRFRNQPEYL